MNDSRHGRHSRRRNPLRAHHSTAGSKLGWFLALVGAVLAVGLTLPVLLPSGSGAVTAPTTSSTIDPGEAAASTTLPPANPTASPEATFQPAGADGPVTIVGESLTLSAAHEIEARLGEVVIDAEVGRSFQQDLAALEELARTDRIGPVVVVHVGNNDDAPEDGFERIHELVGDSRLIVMTVSVPREWESQVNDAIEEFAAVHGDVQILDWKEVTRREPQLLGGDQVHLSPEGVGRYAELVADAVRGRFPSSTAPTRELSVS